MPCGLCLSIAVWGRDWWSKESLQEEYWDIGDWVWRENKGPSEI